MITTLELQEEANPEIQRNNEWKSVATVQMVKKKKDLAYYSNMPCYFNCITHANFFFFVVFF